MPRDSDSVSSATTNVPVCRLALLMCALIVASAGIALNPVNQARTAGDAVRTAVAWLESQRAEDGGYAGFSEQSDPSLTVDVLIALAAARNAGAIVDFTPSLAYLEDEALVYAQVGPGSAAKLTLALVATDQDPRDFASVNPLSIVEVAAARGLIGFGPFDHALGLLALVAGGSDIPEAAIVAATASQNAEGAWSFDGSLESGTGDTNTTALMVQALVATSQGQSDAVELAVGYLLATQTADGVFPYQPGSVRDSNSTALVLQALLAFDPAGNAAVLELAYTSLEAQQNENGSFTWLDDPADENIYSTVQALPAIAGQVFPITPIVSDEGQAAGTLGSRLDLIS